MNQTLLMLTFLEITKYNTSPGEGGVLHCNSINLGWHRLSLVGAIALNFK